MSTTYEDGVTCTDCWGIVPPEGVQMVPEDGEICRCDEPEIDGLEVCSYCLYYSVVADQVGIPTDALNPTNHHLLSHPITAERVVIREDVSE